MFGFLSVHVGREISIDRMFDRKYISYNNPSQYSNPFCILNIPHNLYETATELLSVKVLISMVSCLNLTERLC